MIDKVFNNVISLYIFILRNCKVRKRNDKGKCNVPLFNNLWIDLRLNEYLHQKNPVSPNLGSNPLILIIVSITEYKPSQH